MKCSECEENLSPYLDGELDEKAVRSIEAHLSACKACSSLCEDFAAILDSCRETPSVDTVPPNSQALWCRINNIIETETRPANKNLQQPPPAKGFTFGQLISAVAGIALISSLLTIVGIRNYYLPANSEHSARSDVSPSSFERALIKVGLVESPKDTRLRRFREQQDAIEYWNLRVQQRRAQWDERMREAFDRNLREIDQAVTEYTVMLENNPNDELSGEMLNSAMDEKMNLLRAFAEL